MHYTHTIHSGDWDLWIKGLLDYHYIYFDFFS